MEMGKIQMKRSKRVVIYVRVSKSRFDMTTLATQESECRTFAESMGWEVVTVLIEDGRSAYKKNVKRPKFDRAMQMIETKQADVFLVWKLDRFYRSGTEFNAAWQRIDGAGAQFASVMEQWIDTSTAMGRSQLSALAYQAEIESEARAMRSKAWNRGRVAQQGGAYVPGGQRPYGYDRTAKGELTINDDEALIIRAAVESLLSGGTLKGTLRELSPTSTREGDAPIAMTARGLRSVLTNPTTYGLRRTETGSVIKGCWEPVLPVEVFGKMNAMFDDPNRRTGKTNQVKHLLSGILECGKCGKNLGIRKWKMNANGRNLNGAEGWRYTCECGNSIGEEPANAIVITALFDAVTPNVWESWKIKGHGYDPKVADELTQRIETLDMMMIEGKITNERYDKMNSAIQEQLRLSMSDEPLDLPDGTMDDWDSWSVDDKRKVIRQGLSIIKLNPANGTRNPNNRMEVK